MDWYRVHGTQKTEDGSCTSGEGAALPYTPSTRHAQEAAQRELRTERHRDAYQPTEKERRDTRERDNWGRDIVKARLTQELRGEEVSQKQKIVQLITHIVTAILSGLAGFFGAN